MTTKLNELTTCRHGAMLVNTNDEYVGKSLLAYGEWSEAEIFLFNQIVRPGDVVLEAGANIGSHTVALARAAGESGKVHAFEPQRHAFQLLCANVALNSLSNVYTHYMGLGSENREALFPVVDPAAPNNFGASSFHVAHHQMERVIVRSIDSFEFPRVDFLKADVEGFELEVLQGARETVLRHRPVCHVEYVNPYTEDIVSGLMAYFRDLDYSLWHVITPLYNDHNFKGNRQNEFSGLWSFDMLCLPNEKASVSGLSAVTGGVGYCDDPDAWKHVSFQYLNT
ncbi:FkbM family methyltransferase [Collimonas humicola]|uniref:FkbM family methyltransferase n=1 Tax=Collimonas humicola TaxID=2825886 RepID=UPI001B8BC082|nr:FkbM family methyltransferase [Collimonas humicola]